MKKGWAIKYGNLTILSAIGMFLSYIACQVTKEETGFGVYFSLMITFGTCFYHLFVRLLAGAVMRFLFKSVVFVQKEECGQRKNAGGKRGISLAEHFWFRERAFEKKVYDRLQVKKWKGRMPTYAPETFSLGEYSPDEVIRSMCQAELTHEVNVALSFVPLFFALFAGEFPVFLCTSLAASAFDMIFVIIQRYNRPRLVRLWNRKIKNSRKMV